MEFSITRRTVLGLTTAVGAVVALPARALARTINRLSAVTVDEFMELSNVLTDQEFSLDDEVGAQYLAALRDDPTHAGPLSELVNRVVRSDLDPDTFAQVLASGALDDDANAATAQQILNYWYSGLVNDRTADFLEALAWESQDFATPPSTELGFPDWDKRP